MFLEICNTHSGRPAHLCYAERDFRCASGYVRYAPEKQLLIAVEQARYGTQDPGFSHQAETGGLYPRRQR